MTKKKHGWLHHLFLTCAMLLAMWVVSFYPAREWDFIGDIALIACIVIAICGFALLYFKRLRYMLVLGLCLLSLPALSQVTGCEDEMKISKEAGDLCVYQKLISSADANAMKNYSNKFDPRDEMKSAEERANHMKMMNIADDIVQAYNNLTDIYKEGKMANCNLVDSAGTESVKQRIGTLHNNRDILCAAFALESLDEIYTGSHAERQVESVPMMLGDEKMQCWACDVVYLILVLGNVLSNRVAPAVCHVSMVFLSIGFAFWIALKVGMLLLNHNIDGKEYGGPQFFKEFLTRSLCVGLVALILAPTANQYNPAKPIVGLDGNLNREQTLLDEAYSAFINPILGLISGMGIEISKNI